MNIQSINSSPINSNSTPISTTSTENKTLKNEIAMKEQSLNQLSSDSKISKEEKEKKRQEIKNQIAELNRKLHLLEMQKKEEAEKAQKEQEKKNAIKDELQKDNIHTEQEQQADSNLEDEQAKNLGVPLEDIQKMMNTDYILQRELAAKSIATQRANTIDILETEIQQDRSRNIDTTSKEEELLTMRKMENFWTEHKKETPEPLPSGMNPEAQVIIG